MLEISRRVSALGALTLVAVLPGSPLAHAVAEAAPPVVTVTMDGSHATLSGADHLRSGWTTFRVSSTSADNNLSLFVSRRPQAPPPAPAQPADSTPNAVNPVPDPQPAPAPVASVRADRAGTHAERARVTTAAEESTISLGGVATSKGHDASLTVELPTGTVYLQDLAAADLAKPVAVLTVAPESNGALLPRVDQFVTIDGHNKFMTPRSLHRRGMLQVENIGHGRYGWHDLVLQKLRKGTTRDDVVSYFRHDPGQGHSPFAAPIAGTAPLSSGHVLQISYSLPAGTYALYDIWLDRKTGQFLAGEGAVTLISVTK
jgi:hypothetical protein